MSGQNDVEILDQILTQGLLSAANKFGGKFGELTKSQKEVVRQQAWQMFRQIGYEVSKAVDANYAAAKTKRLCTGSAEVSSGLKVRSYYSRINGLLSLFDGLR